MRASPYRIADKPASHPSHARGAALLVIAWLGLLVAIFVVVDPRPPCCASTAPNAWCAR